MPILSKLIGDDGARFVSPECPADAAVFRADPEWFGRLARLDPFHDPDAWLDLAWQLETFKTRGTLTRSDARREGDRVRVRAGNIEPLGRSRSAAASLRIEAVARCSGGEGRRDREA